MSKLILSEKEYEGYLDAGKTIFENTEDQQYDMRKLCFTQMFDYPTMDDFYLHDIEHHLEEYLPYMLFYAYIYKIDNPEIQKEQKKIRNYLYEHIDVI